MKQKTRQKQPADSIEVGEFRIIPLAEIAASEMNPRKQITQASIKELASSIREHGVLQPILVQEIADAGKGEARYRIIAGERRFRAAKEAGLSEIPATVRVFDEAQVFSVQLVENLQREDVHPLDEALGFERMKEGLQLSIKDLAQKLGKDARYIARRLALTQLIPEAKRDFRQEKITLAHALEICRLAPEIQAEALAACYETTSVYNEERQEYEFMPDKDRPAKHVRYLQEWITQNVHLNLSRAPFQLDDPNLREDGLTCLECPQRSGHNRALFADIKDQDICMNRSCFQGKLEQYILLKKAALESRLGKTVVYLSVYYGRGTEDGTVLSRDQYHLIEKRADRCEYAEQAIYGDGNAIGQIKWICREATCKDHLGRVPDYQRHSNGNSSPSSTSLVDRNKRKQELFDIKVDEAVRKLVMQEAIKTFSWPLRRGCLNEVVKEFFRRIPTEHQRTIAEVLGWQKEEVEQFRSHEAVLLIKIAGFSEDELAQFLMLCSFAHFGAHQHGHTQVDQSSVAQLSRDRGVNHTLIDAEVRLALSPKKYKPAHQKYLNAVKDGRPARKPVVFEGTTQAAEASPEKHQLQKAA
ncbi:MAG TPA: ParB/RepB/Spo0J family partition protein [Blastocatellia bacterium]|nr:ParB/RepB/Spo0J family partition protein [Blastocatellia bacterium]